MPIYTYVCVCMNEYACANVCARVNVMRWQCPCIKNSFCAQAHSERQQKMRPKSQVLFHCRRHCSAAACCCFNYVRLLSRALALCSSSHTQVHTSIFTNVQTNMHTSNHTYVYTYIHSDVHTNIYVRTFIHTYLHTNIHI